MLRNKHTSSRRGFTLIELLVIAPVAILVISGFIALMVTMVGDVIAARAYNVMTYDIQSALNTIEQDVRLSTQFLDTSGTMLSPQGKNGATSAFSSTNKDLILGEITTDKNPVDPTRGFIYYDAPFGCSDPTQIYKNRLHFMTVIYFTSGGSLWRRTYVPAASGTLCQQPWQVNTCAPGYVASAQCQTNDSEILKNVSDFDIKYYANPEDTIELAAASAKLASSIKITLSGQALAAGRNVSASSSARSTKLSAKDITMPIPSAPTVTASSSSGEAVFSWPSVPNASSYIVQYNINGGDWITASDNTTNTTFSVAAGRGDTVFLKIYAKNTTGASTETNASTTIPLWTDCVLQNGWVNYDNGYETCAYTISKAGVVMFKGHISSGSTAANVALFQLPINLRPSTRLMFQTVINPNSSTRVDVNDDGWVRLAAGSSSTYVGLDGIFFIPNDSLYKWTAPTLTNGWSSFGSGFSTLETTQDTSSRVHLRGLIKQGTFSTDTQIAQLPAGTAPGTNENHIFPVRGDSYNAMRISPTGQVLARGISSSYYSTQAMYYPSTYTGWQSFSGAVSGNPGDNQLGRNWVAHTSYATPQYTKSADGIVTLKGALRSGTASSNIYMAKLPAGYRPKKTLAFSTSSSAGVARIDVGESGYIIFRAGNNTWMSLSNISYMAEQ